MLTLFVAMCFCGAEESVPAEVETVPVQSEFEVEVTQLTVQRRPKGAKAVSDFFREPPGGMFSEKNGEGTTVGMRLTSTKKSILGLDGVEVLEFTDDSGNDLPPAKRSPASLFRDSDSPGTTIHVGSFALPARGTKRLHIRARAYVYCGEKTEVIATQVFDLQENESVDVGGGDWQLTHVEDMSQRKDNPKPGTAVTLVSEDPVESVENIEFFDADGKPLAAGKVVRYLSKVNVSIVGPDGEKDEATTRSSTAKCSVAFPPGVDRVKMEVTRYADFETVTMPIDVQVDLGL